MGESVGCIVKDWGSFVFRGFLGLSGFEICIRWFRWKYLEVRELFCVVIGIFMFSRVCGLELVFRKGVWLERFCVNFCFFLRICLRVVCFRRFFVFG